MSLTKAKNFAAFVGAIILASVTGIAGVYIIITLISMYLPIFLASVGLIILGVICGIMCVVSITAASYFKEQIGDIKLQRKSDEIPVPRYGGI